MFQKLFDSPEILKTTGAMKRCHCFHPRRLCNPESSPEQEPEKIVSGAGRGVFLHPADPEPRPLHDDQAAGLRGHGFKCVVCPKP